MNTTEIYWLQIERIPGKGSNRRTIIRDYWKPRKDQTKT
jgi:hypothetical protein